MTPHVGDWPEEDSVYVRVLLRIHMLSVTVLDCSFHFVTRITKMKK